MPLRFIRNTMDKFFVDAQDSIQKYEFKEPEDPHAVYRAMIYYWSSIAFIILFVIVMICIKGLSNRQEKEIQI